MHSFALNVIVNNFELRRGQLDLVLFADKNEFTTRIYFFIFYFSECRRKSTWGLASVFAPQMGSSVCEHQCGSWQGLGRGMGRLQWHMLRFKLSLDPCSSRGPAGAQGGIHYDQTQAGLVRAYTVTLAPERHVLTEPLLFPCHLLEQKKKKNLFYNRTSKSS